MSAVESSLPGKEESNLSLLSDGDDDEDEEAAAALGLEDGQKSYKQLKDDCAELLLKRMLTLRDEDRFDLDKLAEGEHPQPLTKRTLNALNSFLDDPLVPRTATSKMCGNKWPLRSLLRDLSRSHVCFENSCSFSYKISHF